MTFISIVAVGLGIVIILASTIISGAFPDTGQWVGIAITLVGLAMGMPSALQRMFGGPKLVRQYDRYVEREYRVLIVFLKDPPIGRNSFLGRLGVKRDSISSLTVSFQISEEGEVVIPIMQARLYSDNDPTEAGSWRVDLAPTFSSSTSIIVVRWDGAKKKAIVPGDRVKGEVELSAGLYGIEIIYLVDGQPEKEFRGFIVGENADDLTWIKGRD